MTRILLKEKCLAARVTGVLKLPSEGVQLQRRIGQGQEGKRRRGRDTSNFLCLLQLRDPLELEWEVREQSQEFYYIHLSMF